MIGASGLGTWALSASGVLPCFESALRLQPVTASAKEENKTNGLAVPIMIIFVSTFPSA